MIGWFLLSLIIVAVALPAGLFFMNLALYRRLEPAAGDAASPPEASVSVLIPARDEAANIERAVRAALRNEGVDFEVVVLDDHSTDDTAAIVQRIAREDDRVRLENAPPLPAGWNGKQHACHTLARLARNDVFVFIDADVELAPHSLRRMVHFLHVSGAGLISGVPHQTTGTFMERLLIPQIHFILLSYLPMLAMRRTRKPSFSAGCGQLFVARRDAYKAVGGHAAVARSMHDGITLPRAFREAGYMTDLFDADDIATCRMYHSGAEVWQGLCKNAREGMASPGAIGIWTLVLLAQVATVPAAILLWRSEAQAWWVGPALAALMLPHVTRAVQSLRFGQSLLSALLHPLGVALLLVIQWQALLRWLRGIEPTWRGRRCATP